MNTKLIATALAVAIAVALSAPATHAQGVISDNSGTKIVEGNFPSTFHVSASEAGNLIRLMDIAPEKILGVEIDGLLLTEFADMITGRSEGVSGSFVEIYVPNIGIAKVTLHFADSPAITFTLNQQFDPVERQSVAKAATPVKYTLPLDSKYVKASNVTLEWGSYNNDVRKYHTGVDIMTTDANPAVYAIAAGTVVWNSTASTSYGTKYLKYFNAFVIVNHGSYYAYYGHLNSSLKIGDKVAAGVQIGTIRDGYKVDSKGNSVLNTKLNHLHLSISTGSDWVRSGWGYQATQALAQSLFVNPMKYAGL